MQGPRDGSGRTAPPGPVRSGERASGQALAPGTRLQGYTLGHVLGSGGFGITYLAEHDLLRRQVAIKEHFPFEFARRDGQTVRPSEASAPTYEWARTRFLEEARMLARLKHPSIVEVVDVFEANGTAYMVLAYQQGPSMKAWVAGLGRAPTQAELDALLKPLLGALETIHGGGMLHRDIAPDNIIIRPGGDPCLLDFGAAREALRQQSRALSAIVKSGFSPPEQYTREARSQGAWTDIYALGATLYFAVTGERPPEATERMLDDIVISTAARARGPYRSTFLDAIDWALRVKPAERPQTIAAWQASLLSDRPAGPVTRRVAPGAVPAGRPAQSTASAPRAVGPSGGRPAASETVAATPVRKSSRGWIAAAITGVLVLAASGGGYAVHRSIAENRAAAEWQGIAQSTDVKRIAEYAQRHERTSYSRRAHERLAQLQSVSVAEAEAARRRVAAEQRRVEEEQRRAEEQRRREDGERQRLAEERRKEAERHAEAERRRQTEERARLEAERLRIAEEQRRKEEADRQAEAERQRREAERLRNAEEQRRKEAERQAEAERQRLAEEQRRREAEKLVPPPSTAEVKPPPPPTPPIALLPNIPPPLVTPPAPPATEPKAPETPPAPSRAELARQIKQALKGAGCYSGAIDTSWRRQVRVALANYARHAKVTFSAEEPAVEVLEMLRKRSGRVCPLECGEDEIEVKGRCVAKPKPRKEQRQEEAKSKAREPVRKPQAETKAAAREPAKAATPANTGENVYRCDNWNKANTTCINRRGKRCWHSGFRWVCS